MTPYLCVGCAWLFAFSLPYALCCSRTHQRHKMSSLQVSTHCTHKVLAMCVSSCSAPWWAMMHPGKCLMWLYALLIFQMLNSTLSCSHSSCLHWLTGWQTAGLGWTTQTPSPPVWQIKLLTCMYVTSLSGCQGWSLPCQWAKELLSSPSKKPSKLCRTGGINQHSMWYHGRYVSAASCSASCGKCQDDTCLVLCLKLCCS